MKTLFLLLSIIFLRSRVLFFPPSFPLFLFLRNVLSFSLSAMLRISYIKIVSNYPHFLLFSSYRRLSVTFFPHTLSPSYSIFISLPVSHSTKTLSDSIWCSVENVSRIAHMESNKTKLERERKKSSLKIGWVALVTDQKIILHIGLHLWALKVKEFRWCSAILGFWSRFTNKKTRFLFSDLLYLSASCHY